MEGVRVAGRFCRTDSSHEVSDAALADILPLAKRIATALGVPNYNILQVIDVGLIWSQFISTSSPSPTLSRASGSNGPPTTRRKRRLRAR
ncbi:MAG: hypothetical protein BJ554DRAFT_1597 [Olpidium bornovanus]|uniref:Uncharacterized protein n=1 Tax=Olpidium bornovanus TaxID=278681 RepID=A0A8H7ZS64_9FUNG|nr:MAG: hypothetical protein BJ554DRAFT_1597 [Olpidium bornovanus]